ncbi:MAG: sporulation protein YqfD [Oscillospiraceae bacterium]|nr:sporulation protein YqfD [Oscillospiraceae bacterium]
MNKLVNFLRGSVDLEVEGAFPERFLNLCGQRGILFWGVDWPGGQVLHITVTRADARRAEGLGEKARCKVKRLAPRGVPSILDRFRRRYAFVAGLAISLTAVSVLSRYILVIDVSGNESVPTAVILSELWRSGLRPGMYGPSVDERKIANEALLNLPELSWMAINLNGTRAQVEVREGIKAPKLVDKTQLGDITARASGIITRIEAESGQAMVQDGDTVLEGEVVIAGNIYLAPPEYSGYEGKWQQVRAQGRVYARTWRTLTAEIPLETDVKVYSGAEEQRFFLCFFDRRLNIYTNSGISFEKYDKIQETWSLSHGEEWQIPISFGRETVRDYTVTSAAIDTEAARAMLEERLGTQLLQELGEDGTVTSTTCTAAETDGILSVTLVAECHEEIGVFSAWEGQPDGNAQSNTEGNGSIDGTDD